MTSHISDNQIKALVATIDAVATLGANIPLLIVLATSKRLQKDVASRGILSLTIADIGFGAVYPIISATVAWMGPDIQHSGTLYGFHLFVFSTCSLASIWHIALVSIVKCRIIVSPLTEFTERKMGVLISAVWLACVLVTVIVCSLYSDYGFNWLVIGPFGFLRPVILTTFDNLLGRVNGFVFTTIVLIYFLPGIVMICVYVKIFTVVRRQVRMIQALSIESSATSNAHTRTTTFASNVKAAKILLILYSAYLINYFPLFLTAFSGLAFSPWYVFTAHWLYLSSGALNAALYIALNRAVRSELKIMFLFWQKRRHSFESQGDTHELS